MQTKEIPLSIEMENREAIEFLYNQGVPVKQIRYLRYNQIDRERMVLFYENDRGRKRKIKLKSTPVVPLLNRPPISTMYLMYRRIPYKCFQRKLPLLLPPECFYSNDDIELICGAREPRELDDSPLYLQGCNRGELLKAAFKIH